MPRTRKGTSSARGRARAREAFGRTGADHRDSGAGGIDEGVRPEGETFQYLFLHNPQPMWVYDLETLAFLEVNEAATAKYGFTRAQFLAMRIADISPEEDVPRLLADLARPRAVLDAAGEWRHRRSDGAVLDVSVTSHTLSFHRRPAALVVAVDLTERKRAETALRRSTLRLQTLHGIDLAILAANSPTEVARGVTRHLRALLPAQRVAVLAANEALATATYLAVDEDEPMGPPGGTRIPLTWLPASPPLYDLSRQPVRCWEDFAALPERPELLERLLRLGARSAIDAPLVAEGRLIGGLTAVSTTPAAFSEEDMDILGEVASQFAVALHQAQLREHLAAERAKLMHLLEDLPSGVVLVNERGVVLF
ncbi:MAG: GAF domain-containing protein, partial [Acidobacteria bacterium]